MGRDGRRYFLSNFTRARLVDRYEALLTEVARRKGDAHARAEPGLKD